MAARFRNSPPFQPQPDEGMDCEALALLWRSQRELQYTVAQTREMLVDTCRLIAKADALARIWPGA